jgi:N-acetylglucosaminyldiphosphoundecaprenol N-acetyl-beta-D-mannosaminyltransferase
MERIRIQQLPVDRMDLAEALDRILALARTPRTHEPPSSGFGSNPSMPRKTGSATRCARVFFLNAHCANVAWKNPEYRASLESADLVLADGSGVAAAARIQHSGPVPNVNGTDLFPPLMERLADSDIPVFFLGAKRHVVEALVGEVRRRWPKARIAGYRSGYLTDPAAAAQEVAASGAALLFVALGVPRQELWIARHADSSGAAVALAVGGLFDFYSGCMPRAPLWLRRIGMEWIFRLIKEPSRMWRRYLLGNIIFLSRSVWLGRRGGRA